MNPEETIIQIKETKKSNLQIEILNNSKKEEIKVFELKKQIQNSTTENELIHILIENKNIIFDKMTLKDYQEIKTIVSNKTFLSINFINTYSGFINHKILTENLIKNKNLTKQHINEIIQLDWETLKKYKKVKTKHAQKHFDKMLYTNTVFCATHFKIPIQNIIKFVQSTQINKQTFHQIIKFQKYSYKQNIKLILEMKYYGTPLQFKLNKKHKFLSNKDKPKHYSRKEYIKLLSSAIREKQ